MTTQDSVKEGNTHNPPPNPPNKIWNKMENKILGEENSFGMRN